MTSVSAGHIILTSTQPEGSGRRQRKSNQGPPHQESRALPTELLRPSPPPPPPTTVQEIAIRTRSEINAGLENKAKRFLGGAGAGT